MELRKSKLTPAELLDFGNALATHGGELVEIVEGEKIVIKFPDTDSMMVLVGAIKSQKKVSRRLIVNSVIKNGESFLTIEPKTW